VQGAGLLKKMTFWEHLAELRTRLIWIFCTLGAIFLFCFTFGLRKTKLAGWTVVYPYPDIFHNMCAQLLAKMEADLLPSGVELVQLTVPQVVLAQLNIALFLAILLGMPMIVYQLGKFVAPGLYPHEKRIILKFTLPAAILFALGCLFSYYLITPFTINFLYQYGFALGLQTFAAIDSFVSFVLIFVLTFGFAFQLPILMGGLSMLGAVSPRFWARNWRYAAVIIFIFAAAITPDGSGITMLMVALPVLALYAVGYFAARLAAPKQRS
jgi:sec-independent protein translocase protein TatC